jgi:hypothetical protein
MARLALSVAVGDYDRTRPLIDGTVRIDGVDPVVMTLSPEEIFFRAFRDAPFDTCELSLSSFAVKTATGACCVPTSCSTLRHTRRSRSDGRALRRRSARHHEGRTS